MTAGDRGRPSTGIGFLVDGGQRIPCRVDGLGFMGCSGIRDKNVRMRLSEVSETMGVALRRT